jgi:uncharacterized protein YegL
MQPMIPDVVFSDNTNQRTPCVLLLDGSSSMQGAPIGQLYEGLRVFEAQLKQDPTTALRVQVLVLRVGGYDEVEVLTDWCDAIDFAAPVVRANGSTPLGAGIMLALEMVEAQKRAYDANGISSTRPWIMMISDGAPTDPGWKDAAARARTAEQNKKCVVFPIGTEGADLAALGMFSNKPTRRLQGLNFADLFVWLSRSMSVVSGSTPGTAVQLPAAEWAAVEV